MCSSNVVLEHLNFTETKTVAEFQAESVVVADKGLQRNAVLTFAH